MTILRETNVPERRFEEGLDAGRRGGGAGLLSEGRAGATVADLVGAGKGEPPIHERISLRKTVDLLRRRKRRQWITKKEVRQHLRDRIPDDGEFESFWKGAQDAATGGRYYEFGKRGEDEVVTVGRRRFGEPDRKSGEEFLPGKLVPDANGGADESSAVDVMFDHPALGRSFIAGLERSPGRVAHIQETAAAGDVDVRGLEMKLGKGGDFNDGDPNEAPPEWKTRKQADLATPGSDLAKGKNLHYLTLAQGIKNGDLKAGCTVKIGGKDVEVRKADMVGDVVYIETPDRVIKVEKDKDSPIDSYDKPGKGKDGGGGSPEDPTIRAATEGARRERPFDEAVVVTTRHYVNSHGHSPRGFGMWIFFFGEKARREWPDKTKDSFTTQAMNYGDALRAAKEEARKRGLKDVEIVVGESVADEAQGTGEWGVKWTEWGGDNRRVTNARYFETEDQLRRFCERIEKKNNFGEYVAWLRPRGESVEEARVPSADEVRNNARWTQAEPFFRLLASKSGIPYDDLIMYAAAVPAAVAKLKAKVDPNGVRAGQEPCERLANWAADSGLVSANAGQGIKSFGYNMGKVTGGQVDPRYFDPSWTPPRYQPSPPPKPSNKYAGSRVARALLQGRHGKTGGIDDLFAAQPEAADSGYAYPFAEAIDAAAFREWMAWEKTLNKDELTFAEKVMKWLDDDRRGARPMPQGIQLGMRASEIERKVMSLHRRMSKESVTEASDISVAEAKKVVEAWLRQNGISYSKLSAKTVGFSDLGRGSMVFVAIRGWKPNPKAEEIKRIAKEKGFGIEFYTSESVDFDGVDEVGYGSYGASKTQTRAKIAWTDAHQRVSKMIDALNKAQNPEEIRKIAMQADLPDVVWHSDKRAVSSFEAMQERLIAIAKMGADAWEKAKGDVMRRMRDIEVGFRSLAAEPPPLGEAWLAYPVATDLGEEYVPPRIQMMLGKLKGTVGAVRLAQARPGNYRLVAGDGKDRGLADRLRQAIKDMGYGASVIDVGGQVAVATPLGEELEKAEDAALRAEMTLAAAARLIGD